MKLLGLFLLLFFAFPACAQDILQQPFRDCGVSGSTTIYDYKKGKWIFTDSADAARSTLPASTFKVVNLLIALETGVIKDEHDTVGWVGWTDTTLYGYRPEIYRYMSVKEAFEVSAGWVFIELAKRIGRERYRHYLKLCGYGNGDLSQSDADFWNFGAFAVSPINQVEFLVKVYEGKTPFSGRNVAILKKVMVTEKTPLSVTRSKTGWTRVDGKDWGWWVGYTEENGNAVFFATRIWKARSTPNPQFGSCRKAITKAVMQRLQNRE